MPGEIVDDPAVTQAWSEIRRAHLSLVSLGYALIGALALLVGEVPIVAGDEGQPVRAFRAQLALSSTKGAPRARQRDLEDPWWNRMIFRNALIPGYLWRMDDALLWAPSDRFAAGAREIRAPLVDARIVLSPLPRRRTGLVVRGADRSETWLLVRAPAHVVEELVAA